MKRFKGKFIFILMLLIVFTINLGFPTLSYSSINQPNLTTDLQIAVKELKKWQLNDRSRWIEEFQFWKIKSNLTLGRQFDLYNGEIKNKEIVFFEIIENQKPVAILTLIKKSDATTTIQISKSFSSFFLNDLHSNYKIQLKDQVLYAIHIKTNKKSIIQKNSQNGIYTFEETKTPLLQQETQIFKAAAPPLALPYMKKLSVPIINQGPYPWCWAAALTSLTQYDLKVKDNIYKITENNTNKNGNVVKTILPAFKTYGYMPSVIPPLSIYDAKQSISLNKPIYMLSQSQNNGHATLICGYYSENDVTYYLMMDPNRREYVILNASDNDVQYYLGGEVYHWKFTIQY